ncbi:hypothetical protein Mesop_0832 [Mesorhizobium opportunistum WSM2075]|uniref:Uncharacterized protein n=1 Tax=Mesorhizobium opportunistum (strain LMG 24607 / HAMBI 3007 / WSM2075) TaxID=536019 RepID=F7Y914_MESOW|nr:hypothetical protein Mesop_0832 [Mesorhizobium opportunistum WSM2075]
MGLAGIDQKTRAERAGVLLPTIRDAPSAIGGEVSSRPASIRKRRAAASLTVERPWTADEWAAPDIKAQRPVRVLRNADPDALPDFAVWVIIACEP